MTLAELEEQFLVLSQRMARLPTVQAITDLLASVEDYKADLTAAIAAVTGRLDTAEAKISDLLRRVAEIEAA